MMNESDLKFVLIKGTFVLNKTDSGLLEQAAVTFYAFSI